MEPEVTQEQPPAAQPEQSHLAHTYEDDLARAMNATEAPVVQELLADARDREALAVQEKEEHKEEKWYSITALLLIVLTLAVIGVGTYWYTHLTVPAKPPVSVGVFPSTRNIVASTTTIGQLIATLTVSTTLPQDKPTLVNIVTDAKTNALLSNAQLFSFMQATVPTGLQLVIGSARLGVVNTGTAVVPFIVASVPDPQKASLQLTDAEPSLLQMFYTALNISPAAYQNDEGAVFQSQYFYNLPVRTLTDATGAIVFLYGYASNNTVVITTQPQVLKDVYDSIINQN